MKNQKRLGQYFLINENKLQKIVEALDLKPGDSVIEIGSGHGELTRPMAEKLKIENSMPTGRQEKSKIIAIEKDDDLAELMKEKFAEDKNIEIIQGDALKILPKLIDSILRTSDVKKLKIVGNIPYYITGYLLRILSELEIKPSFIILTVQKEVAERICAEPLRRRQGFGGQAKMNLLAASVQFWAEPEIIDYISKKDFQPQPKVDSAIIKLKSITVSMRPHKKCYKVGAEEYYKLIKILFKQPRKTILNNLINIKRSDLPKIDVNIWRSDLQKLLTKIGINPNDRPQNLSVEKIKQLSKIFKVEKIFIKNHNRSI